MGQEQEMGAGEVIRFLPKGFVEAYEGMLDLTFGEGWGTGGNGLAGPESGVVSGGAGFSSRVPLRSGADRGVELRKSVDRRLRALGRTIASALEDGGGGRLDVGKERGCTRCGRFGEAGWTYCAFCAFPVGGAILFRCECGPQIHKATIPDIIYCARRRGVLSATIEDRQVQVEFMFGMDKTPGSVKTGDGVRIG